MAALGALAITGCDSTTGSTGDFVRATDSQVRDLVVAELGDEPDTGGERVRAVRCHSRTTCSVNYVADTPTFSESEILDDQRAIWRALFSDRKLRRAKLTAYGETTSIGGTIETSPIMSVLCDHEAARRIDWSNVDADGMRHLCDVSELVNFE